MDLSFLVSRSGADNDSSAGRIAEPSVSLEFLWGVQLMTSVKRSLVFLSYASLSTSPGLFSSEGSFTVRTFLFAVQMLK